jgi:hypothetical protein
LDSSSLPSLSCVIQHTFVYTWARTSSSQSIACASSGLLLLSHIANFEPILSTSEVLVVVVESKRQYGTIYIHQKNKRQNPVLQGNGAVLVSLYSSVSPRVLEYVTHIAIEMHNCFPDQMFDQGKSTMCRFSMDTALCLEIIVHFHSYTCWMLQAQGIRFE